MMNKTLMISRRILKPITIPLLILVAKLINWLKAELKVHAFFLVGIEASSLKAVY